jgi:hypothetical protein
MELGNPGAGIRTLAAFIFLVVAAPYAGAADGPRPLSAYAHNDYRNARPLVDALELGYCGVEVDVFVERGRLMVAHNRYEIRRGRTLESLYLMPLRAWIRQRAPSPRDPAFVLNVEMKTSGLEAYRALHHLLEGYADILTVVESGNERAGPVRVILVGYHPPFEWLAQQPRRFVAVQRHYADLTSEDRRWPGHLLALVSQRYADAFSWDGSGAVPTEFSDSLARLVAARGSVPGRILRVYEVPLREPIVRALLEGGVDLLGVKKIHEGAEILRRIETAPHQRAPR